MAGDDKTGDARTRVLETAWRMIADRRDAAITLVDVAREANVSRQTVYVNFGSRAGLLRAMVEHRDATSPELGAAEDRAPGATPEQALAGVIRAWFAYIPVVFKVARALSVAGETDADAKAAIESRWQQLRGGFLAIATGLQQAATSHRGGLPTQRPTGAITLRTSTPGSIWLSNAGGVPSLWWNERSMRSIKRSTCPARPLNSRPAMLPLREAGNASARCRAPSVRRRSLRLPAHAAPTR